MINMNTLTLHYDTLSVTLPFSTNSSDKLYISTQTDEITLHVDGFPKYISSSLESNLLAIKISMLFNMQSFTLVSNLDNTKISNLDNRPLVNIDKGAISEFYNV